MGAKPSYRELQILDLVKQGLCYKEISARLGISVPTIKMDMRTLFAKLDARSAAHAVAIAIRKKLINA